MSGKYSNTIYSSLLFSLYRGAGRFLNLGRAYSDQVCSNKLLKVFDGDQLYDNIHSGTI
jgi:hypothetical protein